MPTYYGFSKLGKTIELSEMEAIAKGSLVVGDGSGAPAELTIGSNDTVLIADSSQTTGVKWGTAVKGITTEGSVTFSGGETSGTLSSSVTSGYDFLMLKLRIVNQTASATYGIRLENDSSAVYNGGVVEGGGHTGLTSKTACEFGSGNMATADEFDLLCFINQKPTTATKGVGFHGVNLSSGTYRAHSGAWNFNESTEAEISDVRIVRTAGTGTIASGSYAELYGVTG